MRQQCLNGLKIRIISTQPVTNSDCMHETCFLFCNRVGNEASSGRSEYGEDEWSCSRETGESYSGRQSHCRTGRQKLSGEEREASTTLGRSNHHVMKPNLERDSGQEGKSRSVVFLPVVCPQKSQLVLTSELSAAASIPGHCTPESGHLPGSGFYRQENVD